MDHIPVESSNIAAIGYDKEAKRLEIIFKNHGIYAYSGVPEETYKAFLAAESLGSYFTWYIRGKFPTECLHKPPKKGEK